VGLEYKTGTDATERAEGQGEAYFVAEFGDGGAGCGVEEFGEMVVVLEEGKAAALLGVLEESFRGDVVMADSAEMFVGRDECGDEGVVFGGEAELPAAPDDAAVGDDVAGDEAAVRARRGHAEGLLDEGEAGRELEEALDGCVDEDGFADDVHACFSMRGKLPKCGCGLRGMKMREGLVGARGGCGCKLNLLDRGGKRRYTGAYIVGPGRGTQDWRASMEPKKSNPPDATPTDKAKPPLGGKGIVPPFKGTDDPGHYVTTPKHKESVDWKVDIGEHSVTDRERSDGKD